LGGWLVNLPICGKQTKYVSFQLQFTMVYPFVQSSVPKFLWVTLRNSIASIAMENGPVNRTDFYDVPVQISSTILIFHGYVKLPNGKPACEKYPAPLPQNQVAVPPFSYLQSILIGSRKWVV
jgi:hypothetical protein